MSDETGRCANMLAELRARIEKESSDGVRLINSPHDNPICSINYDGSIPAIVVVWKSYATSSQIRFVHEYILQLIEKHAVSKILGDDRALITIHSDDQRWIVEDWMPRAIAAGLRAGASRVPSSYFGKLSVSRVQAEAPDPLVLRLFAEVEEARTWLQSLPG